MGIRLGVGMDDLQVFRIGNIDADKPLKIIGEPAGKLNPVRTEPDDLSDDYPPVGAVEQCD